VDAGKEQHSIIPFGLLELDSQGTVVNYSPARERVTGAGAPARHILGKNFFDEVMPVLPVREFKERFLRFMSFGDSVERFTIRFPLEEREVRVQIMLARITERTERSSERLALVRFMPESFLAYRESAAA
jgi:photoactive yellow protein